MPVAYAPPPPVVQVQDKASTEALSKAELDNTLMALQQKMPNTVFVSIEPTPVKGLYAVRTVGKKLFYTDATGRFFIAGIIFDTTTGKALFNALDGSKAVQQDFDE